MTLTQEEIRERKRTYNRAYRERVKGSLLLPDPANHCLICPAGIPTGYTVCGPEHGAILTAQFAAWIDAGAPRTSHHA